MSPTSRSTERLPRFGSPIPSADPAWYQQRPTPYYDETHAALRAEVRQWIDQDVAPHVADWDEQRCVPPAIYREAGRRGYLAALLGVRPLPVEFMHDNNNKNNNNNDNKSNDGETAAAGGTGTGAETETETEHGNAQNSGIVRALAPRWDGFHELVVADEMSRAGSAGFVWSMMGGFGIGAPPLVRFGRRSLKERVLPGILSGRERICLAVTEPGAGSDVAGGLQCRAERDGKGNFVVNGVKKWITNGVWCEYFTVAVRTGGEGAGGISLLVVERSRAARPGGGRLTTRPMDCMGAWASGTALVTFEDVVVPEENLLGEENEGFKLIMSNFNHERIGVIIQATRFSRVCYEAAFQHSLHRETFGKKLIEHGVIRAKLGHMARRIEASWNWLEALVYQTGELEADPAESMRQLAGPTASLKVQSSLTFEFCAREAAQIFGGLSYTRGGGRGGAVERLYREVRALAIPGGSEEVMLDLSVRQSVPRGVLSAKL